MFNEGDKVQTLVHVCGIAQRMAVGQVVKVHSGYCEVDIMSLRGGAPWIVNYSNIHLEPYTTMIENEISVDPQGNATVYGTIAHLLWDYCKGEFPKTKCCHNNFYVMERKPFPQGLRWDIVAGQTTKDEALQYMDSTRVLIDVTNAPKV